MTDSQAPPPRAKDRILDVAYRLFYQDGIRATGIDRIIAESGVAKMSFYRNFKSKADLVAAYLNVRHDWWMAWFTDRVERALPRYENPFCAIADALEDWFTAPDFRGCAFINGVAENGQSGGEELRIAQQHKAGLKRYLLTLAEKAGRPSPDQTAEAALIIIEGTIIRAQMQQSATALPACRLLLSTL